MDQTNQNPTLNNQPLPIEQNNKYGLTRKETIIFSIILLVVYFLTKIPGVLTLGPGTLAIILIWKSNKGKNAKISLIIGITFAAILLYIVISFALLILLQNLLGKNQ